MTSDRGWCRAPLGDFLTRITYGFTNPMPTTESGCHMVTAKDIRGGRIDYVSSRFTSLEAYETLLTDKSRPRVGDVLLTKDGSIGRVAVCDRPNVCINQSVALLQPNAQVDSRFLAYLLQAPVYQERMAADADGSTIKHIYITRVDKMSIDVPGLSEQRAIADVLCALDAKVSLCDRVSRVSEGLIAALHKRALVRDGVRTRPLLDVLDVNFGEPFRSEHFSACGVGRPLIRIRDLKSGEPQTWTTEIRPNETIVRPGDVVVGMDAEFRATCWVGDPGLLNQRVCRVRSREMGPAFVEQALRGPLASIEGEKSGTTVIHLNKSDLARTAVQVPSAAALSDFEAVAEPIYGLRVASSRETRQLIILRDHLLPLLTSGKVRVRDAEKWVEEVG